MLGILLLAHGSRAPETLHTMDSIADLVRSRLPHCLIQTAYMEFCDINIEKGLTLLMNQGVTEVKVVPYFLFDGIHIREDIPQELNNFRKAHPHLIITMTPTLGADPRLADIVAERISG